MRWAASLAGLGIPLLGVLLAILAIRPFYGVVDDSLLLAYARDITWAGLPEAWIDRLRYDVTSWGMVRPFYWAIAYVQYRAGAEGPTVLYLLNWLVLGAILVLAGIALARAFRVPAASRPLFLGVYGAAVFLYPWTLDLFAFASYQEKWVILAAALGLLWLADPREQVRPAAWYAASVAVIALGSLTKAQFLIFLPAFLLLVADSQRGRADRWRRVAGVAVAGAVAGIALRIVAAHGDYTADYGLHNVPEQLRDRYIWLLSALVLAWTVYAAAYHRRHPGSLARDLVPSVTFIAFVAVFAQWPGGFLYSVIGFVLAGAFALAVTRLARQALAGAALGVTLVAACGWIWVRTDALYSSLASIGEFARSAEARSVAASGAPVYVSCEEGSAAIAGYVRREQGLVLTVSPERGRPWESADDLPPPDGFRYALADARLCPASIDESAWVTVWRPSREGGFTLYRRR